MRLDSLIQAGRVFCVLAPSRIELQPTALIIRTTWLTFSFLLNESRPSYPIFACTSIPIFFSYYTQLASLRFTRVLSLKPLPFNQLQKQSTKMPVCLCKSCFYEFPHGRISERPISLKPYPRNSNSAPNNMQPRTMITSIMLIAPPSGQPSSSASCSQPLPALISIKLSNTGSAFAG